MDDIGYPPNSLILALSSVNADGTPNTAGISTVNTLPMTPTRVATHIFIPLTFAYPIRTPLSQNIPERLVQ